MRNALLIFAAIAVCFAITSCRKQRKHETVPLPHQPDTSTIDSLYLKLYNPTFTPDTAYLKISLNGNPQPYCISGTPADSQVVFSCIHRKGDILHIEYNEQVLMQSDPKVYAMPVLNMSIKTNSNQVFFQLKQASTFICP